MDILAVILIVFVVGAMFYFGQAVAKLIITFVSATFIMGFVDPAQYVPALAHLGIPAGFLNELQALHLTCEPFALWCVNIFQQITG